VHVACSPPPLTRASRTFTCIHLRMVAWTRRCWEGIVQKALALPHCSSCASRSRTALCTALALRLLPPRALVLYFLSHRIAGVQNTIHLFIHSGCGLCVVLRRALCASDAGEGGTGLGFGVLALANLKPDNGLILSKDQDDGMSVHAHAAALADPHTLPYVYPACLLPRSFSRLEGSSAHRMHLRRQLVTILCELAIMFTTWVRGGGGADCALARIARFVAAPDSVSARPHQRRRVDCGPLVSAVPRAPRLSSFRHPTLPHCRGAAAHCCRTWSSCN
jgi:hypothetical protein